MRLHNPSLAFEYRWTINEAWQTWKTIESTRRSPPFSVPLLPCTTFHISMFTRDTEKEIEWSVSCDNKNQEDAFEFYLWKGDKKTESEEDIVETDTRHAFVDLSHCNQFCCKVVYKYCRAWIVEKVKKMNRLAENADKLTKRLQRALYLQATRIANLTDQRDNLTAKWLREKEEGELWKMTAREHEHVADNLNIQLQLLLDNQPLNDISEALWQLQKESKLTDFSLIVDDKSIEVHKNVLAVNSSFFAQEFEKHPDKSKYLIDGTSFEAVGQIVEFLYLGKAEKIDEHLAELHKLSSRFGISALKMKCMKLLKSKLSIETSPELFILSIKHNDEKLSRMVVEYAKENGGKRILLLSDAFHDQWEIDLDFYLKVVKMLHD
ncbi:BTB domain-containing protein [Aphelenchoides besseyi]|nr:BTB domain-containing protein [Aphelenchoides besseyi]KAI6198708.1 BTB domain-containing protein [Aphelenchoides besseyi]